MPTDVLHRKLRQLIGQRFDYLDEVWVLIEVLGVDCTRGSVQRSVYGAPTRRASDTLSLPISSPDGEDYSQDILLLLEGRRPSSAG